MKLFIYLRKVFSIFIGLGAFYMLNGFSNDEIYVEINNQELRIKLESNSSSTALYEVLQKSDLNILMNDYGGFEKVGRIDKNLPTNDKYFQAKALDLILYNANNIVIYYDNNSWSFTKLGTIYGISKDELKKLLGNGKINARFYVKNKD